MLGSEDAAGRKADALAADADRLLAMGFAANAAPEFILLDRLDAGLRCDDTDPRCEGSFGRYVHAQAVIVVRRDHIQGRPRDLVGGDRNGLPAELEARHRRRRHAHDDRRPGRAEEARRRVRGVVGAGLHRRHRGRRGQRPAERHRHGPSGHAKGRDQDRPTAARFRADHADLLTPKRHATVPGRERRRRCHESAGPGHLLHPDGSRSRRRPRPAGAQPHRPSVLVRGHGPPEGPMLDRRPAMATVRPSRLLATRR